MQSSTPKISVSVELWVLSFYFMEVTTVNPLPMESPPTLCPLMLGWTANDSSIHHFRITVPPPPRMSGIFLVLLRHFIIWANFFQLLVSSSLTLVVRNTTDVQVSGISLLVVYSVLDTRLWNPLALSGIIFSQSLSTLNRFSSAVLDLVPLLLGSILSNSFSI